MKHVAISRVAAAAIALVALAACDVEMSDGRLDGTLAVDESGTARVGLVGSVRFQPRQAVEEAQ